MPELHAVIFDLGGVLIRTVDHRPRAELAARWGLTAEELAYRILESPIGTRAQLGELHPHALWKQVLGELGETVRDEDIPALERAFWGGDRFDGVLIAHLRQWRGRYRLGLLSNAWITLRAWLATTPLHGLFDAVVISAEEGLMKPDPRIYARMLGALAVLPHEAAFVDDRPENVDVARRLGMHAIRFESTEQVLRELGRLGLPLYPSAAKG